MLYSKRWKTWKTEIDDKTCLTCRENNGKIYPIDETPYPRPPVHLYCRCTIGKLCAIPAGNATSDGINGADWQLKYHGILSNYYITKEKAKQLGWSSINGDLSNIIPGKMIFGGVYYNYSKKLPETPERIWYEADINYTKGYRNSSRILFSNDGLIFVTYDHYRKFYEIV